MSIAMINIETPSLLEKSEIESWPVWKKEPCCFDWDYTENEQFYILEGMARLTSESGIDKTIKTGDLVTIEKGSRVKWCIIEAIKKHYRFF